VNRGYWKGAAWAALFFFPAAALPQAVKPAPPKLTVAQRAAVCFACHGAKGQSQLPLTPSLGAQPSFFVVAQLFLFRDARRGNAPVAMTEAAKTLTDDDLRAFADLISKLPAPPPPAEKPPDAQKFARGRALVLKQNCTTCHNPDLSGREQMPRLANQREDYLLKALRDYKSGARLGYGGAMAEELSALKDADLVDLAHFLAYLPAKPASK
jgi:cytochrome c553